MDRIRGPFDMHSYLPVAERIRLFYARHPRGRILTELISKTEQEVVFAARVYRSEDEVNPAATGWAAERQGDGEINLDCCLENTETSAVGRALANLGLTGSRYRPSAEEMTKPSRARILLNRQLSAHGIVEDQDSVIDAANAAPRIQAHADATLDALRLLGRAAQHGLAPERQTSLASKLRAGASLSSIERLESLLRKFLTSSDVKRDAL